jgi:hypothetical protein
MLTRTKLLMAAGVTLATALNAAGQDVNPPPGFSPAAPRAATPGASQSNGPGSGSGFLQRLGGSSAPQDSGQGSDFPAFGDPYSDAPAAPQYSSSSPDVSQAPTYSGGNFIPPDTHPVFQAPAVYAPRFWLKAEALYWWTKASPLPVPVITQGSLSDMVPGAIGQPGTSVLIGNQDISLPGRGGGRFTLGFALDQEATWAFETNYFFLSSVTVSQGVSSDGSPGSAALFLPYFDPVLGQESSTFISDPGFFAGSAVVALQSFVQGVEANVLFNLSNAGAWRWDGLAGFRYLNLHETLTLSTSSPDATTFFNTFDRFDAQNNFYGGQLGARVSYESPWLFFNGTAKLALGGTVESVATSGGLFSSGGSAAGGYFTQPSNLGSQSQSQFAVVPGADLNFGIRLSPWASVVVGYSFLYVSSVARPGDQLDHVINPGQSPLAFGVPPSSAGPARPALVVRDTDFWVQGLTFSLQFQY